MLPSASFTLEAAVGEEADVLALLNAEADPSAVGP
jgi:hypothetical protein